LREEAIRAIQRGRQHSARTNQNLRQRSQNPNDIVNRTRTKTVNYFDPSKNRYDAPNFWDSGNKVADFFAKPQNYRIPIANTFKATPQNNLGSQIGAGAQNLVAGAVDDIVNIPQRFLEGGNRFASIKRD